MNTNEKLSAIRKSMEKYELDAYIIPSANPHQSEYLPEEYKLRQWVTGFTGSNGLAVITKDEAKLWTDGRYFIQAEKEIAGSEFQMMKIATPGYPNYIEWLTEVLDKGSKIGLDGEIYSQENYEALYDALMKKSIYIIDNLDLVTPIWEDRPMAGREPAFNLETKYAGKSAAEKIEDVRLAMKKDNIDMLLLSSLEDINWLYNVRGKDIKNTPVVVSYAIVTHEYSFIFVDLHKINMEVQEELAKNGVDVEDYSAIYGFVNGYRDMNIWLDKSKVNRRVFKAIDESNTIVDRMDITTEMKAIKSPVEIENIRETYIKDGVALTKYLHWLKVHPDKESLDEVEVANKLFEFRSEQELFIETSFDTISAYGANAAMMHYSATPEAHSKLAAKGLYLVDSGGQYYGGTTDVTRTIALGEITDEEKTDFTLVLKAHMNLANAIFLQGTTGQALDVLSRAPIWKHRMDYKSGTGHGIGFVLGVHEGPHRIAYGTPSVELLPGMIVSIEPGIYKQDKHGIRTENIVLVVDDELNGDGQFRRFETLSFVPIDLDCIDASLLNEDERAYVNDYHSEVYNKLEAHLNDEERSWLREATKAI